MFKSKARGFPVNRYHFCLLARDAQRPQGGHPCWSPQLQSTSLAAGAPARCHCCPGHPACPSGLGTSHSQQSSQPRVRQLAREAAQSFTWLRVLMHPENISLQFGHESKLGLESSGLVKLLGLQRCTTFRTTRKTPEQPNGPRWLEGVRFQHAWHNRLWNSKCLLHCTVMEKIIC